MMTTKNELDANNDVIKRYFKSKIPYSLPYQLFKSQILHSHVVIEELKKEDMPQHCRYIYNMPSLDDDVLNSDTDESDDSIAELRFLDKFDASTQLLLLSLLSRRPADFKNYLVELDDAELLPCAAVLLATTPSNRRSFINKVVMSAKPRIRGKVATILLAIIMECARKRDLITIGDLLDLVYENELNLTSQKVEVLDPHFSKKSTLFLLVELILLTKGIDTAWEFLQSQKLVHELLKVGNLLRDDYVVYGQSICSIMCEVYNEANWKRAVQFCDFNFELKVLPPESHVWGPLALATLLKADDCSVEKVYKFVTKLMEHNVGLPERFQRATLVVFQRFKRKYAKEYFQHFSAYACTHKAIGRIGPISCIDIKSYWTREEMEVATAFAMRQVSVKRAQATGSKINFVVVASRPQEETYKLLVEPEAMLLNSYLAIKKNPLPRLQKAIHVSERIVSTKFTIRLLKND